MNIFTFSNAFSRKALSSSIAIFIAILSIFYISSFSSKVYAEESNSEAIAETIVLDTSIVEETAVEEFIAVVETTPVVEEEEIAEAEVETVVEEVPPVEEVTTSDALDLPVEILPLVMTPTALPVLSTDKDDYHPGETATIFGRFFTPFQNFILKVFGSDDNSENYTESTQEVSTDDTGSFSFAYLLDMIYRPFYEVVVTTLGGEKVAETWFRDSSVGTYDQCSNDDGDGYATGNTGCRWVTGAIGQSNSVYFEGDSTPQRVWLEGFAPNTSHTVTFKYGTTKGGKHAYDYLTSFKASENWIAVADQCESITGCTTALETTVAMQNDPNVDDTIEPLVGREFTIRGGTISNVSIPTIDTGTYAADSETIVTVTFTTDASGSMCSTKKVQGQDVTTCGVAIWFGAHIANSAEWFAFNGDSGAGSIQGNPYHVALAAVDSDSTSGGGRDNQMSAAVIVIPTQATLTLLKTVINDNGGTAIDTNWTLSANGPTPISGTEGQSAITNALVDAGIYTLSESAGPAGYAASTYSCVVNGGNPVVSNSLTLAPEDEAVCTIVNDDNAPSLTLIKEVVNDNGGTAVASDWTLTASGYDTQSPNAGTYQLSESGPSGYAQTSLTCSNSQGQVTSVTLGLGENVTCTFVNNDQPSHLKLVKVVTNNNGGTAAATDWTLSADGITDISGAGGAESDVSAGVYTLSESAGPSGYTASAWSCVGGTQNGSQITLTLGQSATCTITNDDNQSYIIVDKTVTNNNGGTASANDFLLKVDGNAVSDGVAYAVNPGQHTATETNLPGYTASAWGADCAADGTVTIALGETKTCTITNDDQQAYIVIDKTVVNDDGGTALPDDFLLTVGATPVLDGIAMPINPGSYVTGETLLPGYTASDWGGDCTTGGNVSVALGETKTCTITNNDIAPKLTVIKHVVNDNGGTAVAGDFTMNVAATNPSDASFPGVEDVGITITLGAGNYVVSEESEVNGYVGSFSTDCTGTIAIGQEKTCTITNDDKAPKLTLNKILVKDNGGNAVESDWTLTATGPTSISGPGAVGSTDVVSDSTFFSGAYTLSESTGPSGYAASEWTCSNGDNDGTISLGLGDDVTCSIKNDDIAPKLTLVKTVLNNDGGNAVVSDFPLFIGGLPATSGVSYNQTANVVLTATETNQAGYTAGDWGGDCAVDGTITLLPGDDKTCTITNDDVAPKLTITKIVTNDNGGTKVVSDFPLFVNANSVTSGEQNTVSANTLYTVTETNQAGYTASVWGGDCAEDGTITLNEGDVKSCTITNDDDAPTLTLNKVVVNDNGGTAEADEFTLTAEGPTGFSGVGPTVSNGASFDVGQYNLSETNLPGYTASDWSCSVNGGGEVNGASITLGLGDDGVCTITNDDQTAHLKIVKNVVNDNGGKAVATDWTLSADGAVTDISGAGGTESDVNAGVYTLSETGGSSGYTASAWSCVGGIQNGSTVALALGESAICTITNDDITPELTVIKHVINDNGGTAVAGDFTMNVAGTNVLPNSSFAGSEVGTVVTLDAGAYSVDESNVSAYTKIIGINCEGTIAVGEKKTCTITNDDNAPTLHLRKIVVNDNGGTATVADFTLTANGTGANDLSGTSPVDSDAGLKADTWALFENSVAGYSASDWVCIGGVQNGSSITLGLGQDATCTITNDDIQPKLTLIKTVVNNNGGTKVVSDFPLFVDATGVVSGVETGFNAGNYTATETNKTGYTASVWGGDCAANGTISLSIGDDKTCTITNDDQPAKITIVKDADPNDLQDFAFSGTLGSFSLDDDLNVVGSDNVLSNTITFSNKNTGSYTITETQPNQYWVSKFVSCVDNANNGQSFPANIIGTSLTVNLPLGADVTCTFVNEKLSPTRTQGFWQTHTQYTTSIFNSPNYTFSWFAPSLVKIGSGILGGSQDMLKDIGDVFGAFWSNIANKSTGKGKTAQRTELDKARMQLAQQLMAAKLNCAAFGCTAGVQGMIAVADSHYATGTVSQILADVSLIDAYNNSGDTLIIGNVGKADPKQAKAIANYTFWDQP